MTLAAYAIPVSLAYASLAGLPPEFGIYCYLVGGIGYAVFGSSRQLAVGPTSAIAMLVGTTVAGMAAGDGARWADIAALTALVVAALGAIAWLFRLSGLVSFISETILIGFKAGAALTIALTQLPKLFGVPGGGDNFFERLWVLAGQLGQTNLVVLALGAAAMVLLVAGDRLLPGRPVALAVVAASIVVVSVAGLAQHGVSIVGVLPADCRTSPGRRCGPATWTACCRGPRVAFCGAMWRASPPPARWREKTATKSTRGRSYWRQARPTY